MTLTSLYKPKMKPLQGIKLTEPYVSSVLPTVFDDSLSYYETICKLAENINEINAYMMDAFVTEFRAKLSEIIMLSMYDEENETLYLNFKTGDDENV